MILVKMLLAAGFLLILVSISSAASSGQDKALEDDTVCRLVFFNQLDQIECEISRACAPKRQAKKFFYEGLAQANCNVVRLAIQFLNGDWDDHGQIRPKLGSFVDTSGIMIVKEYIGYPLIMAVDNGNKELLNLLLEYQADVNIGAKEPYSPLHAVCMRNMENAKDLAKLLLDGKADANSLDSLGQTSLFYALENGNFSLATLLLDQEIKPSFVSFSSMYDLIIRRHGQTESMLQKIQNVCSFFVRSTFFQRLPKEEQEQVLRVISWNSILFSTDKPTSCIIKDIVSIFKLYSDPLESMCKEYGGNGFRYWKFLFKQASMFVDDPKKYTTEALDEKIASSNTISASHVDPNCTPTPKASSFGSKSNSVIVALEQRLRLANAFAKIFEKTDPALIKVLLKVANEFFAQVESCDGLVSKGNLEKCLRNKLMYEYAWIREECLDQNPTLVLLFAPDC